MDIEFRCAWSVFVGPLMGLLHETTSMMAPEGIEEVRERLIA